MMLYVKDQFNVSGSAYHDMAKICQEMPRHYKLQKRINVLNELWDIKPMLNGLVGVQQSLQDRLSGRIKHLLKEAPPNAPFRENKKCRVKLSSDGTSIGKRLHVINFTFTVLDEGDKAYSADGNHSLAIFREPETYEALESALEDIITEVDNLQSVEVDGTQFEIQYFLGGDWKFRALVTGKLHVYVCVYVMSVHVRVHVCVCTCMRVHSAYWHIRYHIKLAWVSSTQISGGYMKPGSH